MEFSTQELIETGMAWRLEGHIGRQCMAAIDDGRAVLGTAAHRDYYGNRVPSRFEVQSGTLGSQAYAHHEQGHTRPYVTCRAGTCALPRKPTKEHA